MKKSTFSGLDYWRLADELSVIDAAFLTLNLDPGHFRLLDPSDPSSSGIVQIAGWSDSQLERAGELDDGTPLVNPSEFQAVFKALRNAILGNKLKARIVNLARHAHVDYGRYGHPIEPEDSDEEIRSYGFALSRGVPTLFSNADPITDLSYQPHERMLYVLKEPDWSKTTIEVDELKSWFLSRGAAFSFFFPEGVADGFRDKSHERYSPKLATAVAAWEAVKRPAKNKSVKQSLIDWIISNGVSFGMGNADNIVTPTAAEDVAKIANWHTAGGATPTQLDQGVVEGGDAEHVQNFQKVTDKGAQSDDKDGDLESDIPF